MVVARFLRFLAAVACPKLRRSPCLRVAWSVIEGRIPLADVDRVLASLKKTRATLQAPASAYFIRAMQRVFARHGVAWLQQRSDR